MSEQFYKASRLRLRFDTPQGPLSVEDLWDLPLTNEGRVKRANLDDIAIALDRQLKDASTVSFVRKTTTADGIARLKFEIVLKVIEDRQAEIELATKKAANAAHKQQLLGILAQKEMDSLATKSVDEIKALLAEL